jgi:hypothetical protein
VHDVSSFVTAIVCARDGSHDFGVVADEHNLATGRVHILVFDATEEARGETGAIDDYFGWLARVVKKSCFRYVFDDTTLDDHSIGETLSC